jgi:GH3 auxin-responsive promoter
LDTSAWWYHLQPNTRWFENSKGLIMGGSWQYYNGSDIIVGDVSALLMQFMPFYAKWFQTPNLATALLPSWEEKLAKMVQICIKEPVTNISGVPTWTLLLFKQMLELTGKDNMLEIFPRFEVYMHGGVGFAPYKEQFAGLFPSPTVQYREIYNASEGFFAAQVLPQVYEGMLLYLDNHVFFEFVPLSDLEGDAVVYNALTVGEVELNKPYALVISTNAGLWRYLIGDVVEFTHLYPHHIKIVGRTKQYINVFGEELMVANADAAVVLVCAELNAAVCEYTVAPIYIVNGQKGGHEWLIEFDKTPIDVNLFAKRLDFYLCGLNSDYAAKRAGDVAMLPLKLQVLNKGSFHRWLRSKGKMGGQNKVPRLSNHREVVNSVLDSLK